jgi:hypothetical protein
VRAKIEVSPVTTLAEALSVTLRDTDLHEGRLHFGGAPESEGRATPQ